MCYAMLIALHASRTFHIYALSLAFCCLRFALLFFICAPETLKQIIIYRHSLPYVYVYLYLCIVAFMCITKEVCAVFALVMRTRCSY